MRNKAEKRHNDWRKAIRKRNIVHHIYGWSEGWYDNLHQYSKNKVHCSCPMCSAKTRNKGRHRKYAPAINYRRMDMRRQMAMTADEQDFYES